MLDNYKIIQSMSGKGNCYDNAVAESFFHTLKTELIYWNSYKTRSDAKSSIFQFIEGFYNRRRRHSIIKVVTGLRRSGKSTLLQIFRDDLSKNKISDKQIQF